ncbi:MAG: tetratricopeptide repeat protein, partial [Gaiellaceae bacterium]
MTPRAARASIPGTVAAPRVPRLGERLRQLRVAAGLTQTDLAGDRFSKEYISQIERGKTRPTTETVEWLALRLGVDSGFLASGVSADERAKAEAILARADALSQEHRFPEAIEEYTRALPAVLGTGAAELRVRALNGEAMAHAQTGDVKAALALLAESRSLVEGDSFTDVDRAEVLYRLGVCRYKLSSITTAVALFGEALALAERSGLPADQLRLNIFAWRSRCYRRQRDYEAAREDVERALELAEALRDARALAPVYFQASMLAERDGHWVLARTYAEKAKAQYEEVADRGNIGRLLNNLGAMDFLLGNPDEAIERFKQAYAIALEVDRSEDAATAVSSLAPVHLRTGDSTRAEEQARHALEILGERDDMLDEIGNARLVLGRALLEQDRLDEADSAFAAAEDAFARLSSAS